MLILGVLIHLVWHSTGNLNHQYCKHFSYYVYFEVVTLNLSDNFNYRNIDGVAEMNQVIYGVLLFSE